MDLNALGSGILIGAGVIGVTFATRIARRGRTLVEVTSDQESDERVYVWFLRLIGSLFLIFGLMGLLGSVHLVPFGGGRIRNTLATLVVIAMGATFVLCRRSLARTAKRQNEAFWGQQFDERIYLFAFKYGGLVFVTIGLLALCGVITWDGK